MSLQFELLQTAIEAYQQQRYHEAVEILENYCSSIDHNSKYYLQVQFWLIKAYQKNQRSRAIALARQLATHPHPEAQKWAKLALESLNKQSQSRTSHTKPKRAAQAGIKLAMAGVASNLALASGVTITLLLGMVFVLFLALTFILSSDNPTSGLMVAIAGTLLFNTAAFFLSPLLMDLMQNWLYRTRWVSLAEIQRHSPETARIIQRICGQQKLQQPRLGIIDDQNPTAFTYGSLPNTARLVVSQGLFTYLEDEEIATVYAHELGHIVHWDFAVMTLASTPVQITYLIYTFARKLGRSGGEKIKNAAGTAAAVAYVFYLVGTYLLLYLSRTREYYADHFAAESTGNPNALSRALVKIAYGILEESKHATEPSRLIEGTRALGIYDAKAATATGTAYRIAQPQQLGRVFLWDMFNPWGWFMELNSTHPLTGKRVRALSTYAEQLGLETEFDFSRVIAEGKSLDKKKLYGNFALDILLYSAEAIGILIGFVVGLLLFSAEIASGTVIIATVLIGFGIGTFIKTAVMFPNFQFAASSDVLELMSNPYASPLRGKPIQLKGELIGRGDAGYQFGSDLKLQDCTGMIYLRYASRFGAFGNLFFGMNRVKNLIGSPVSTVGWFRRGVMPWLDLAQLRTDAGTVVNSYHRFWLYVTGGGAIILGVVILPMLA
ncbi:M48 family metalloprotease [Chroogloeocystis siderophila]|uniref:Peptidase M48 n=1 Tax=Chroogloeocystis siderophila 5.2 s.c.1 TaxID=247279 RepID=A0A1U7I0E7_9CHRO|nr:M48 family metalloprotease [Chroogloeocystis siderophila]OKH29300.1 peptidase M48 [Chroogloeocystis siderophila 5.2 s.c.1]